MADVILQSIGLEPALIDLLWTAAMTSLLLLAGSMTVWILPWSDRELEDVRTAAHHTALNLIPDAPAGVNAQRVAVKR